MPTIIRRDGFQVVIWTNDHEPMHVHIFKAGGELAVNLGDSNTAVSVRDNFGMSNKDERKAFGYSQRKSGVFEKQMDRNLWEK